MWLFYNENVFFFLLESFTAALTCLMWLFYNENVFFFFLNVRGVFLFWNNRYRNYLAILDWEVWNWRQKIRISDDVSLIRVPKCSFCLFVFFFLFFFFLRKRCRKVLKSLVVIDIFFSQCTSISKWNSRALKHPYQWVYSLLK